jgi:hypothetical protein
MKNRTHARAAAIPDTPRVAVRCEAISLRPFSIKDVSLGGARIQLKGLMAWLMILFRKIFCHRQIWQAELLVEGRIVASIWVKVVHFSGRHAGFQFVNPSRHVIESIRLTFGPEIRGAEMKPSVFATARDRSRLRFSNPDSETVEFLLEDGHVKFINVCVQLSQDPRDPVMHQYMIDGSAFEHGINENAVRDLKRTFRNLPCENPTVIVSALELIERSLMAPRKMPARLRKAA